MSKRVLLSVVLSVLFAPAAWAGSYEYLRPGPKIPARKDCTDLRLQSPALGEPRRQTNTPWCYAFMSADLLSWELGERVSAADTSLLYNDFERGRERTRQGLLHSDMRRGGDPQEAIDIVLKRGACLEQDFPSQDYLVPIGNGQGEEILLLSMIEGIEGVKREFDRTRSFDGPCNNFQAFREIFPWLQWRDLRSALEESSSQDFVSRLQANACDGRRKSFKQGVEAVTIANLPSQRFDTPGVQAAMIRRVDELLESGKLPGIGVRADFVGGLPEESDHAVSLAGRRPNPRTGACEYLVRDSNDHCDSKIFTCEANGDRWASEDHIRGKLKWVFYVNKRSR